MSLRREKCFELVADEVWFVRQQLEAAQEVVGARMISIVGSEVFHRCTDHTEVDTSGERANVCMAHRDSVKRLLKHFKTGPKFPMGVEYKRSTGTEMRTCRVSCSRIGALDAGPGEPKRAKGSGRPRG